MLGFRRPALLILRDRGATPVERRAVYEPLGLGGSGKA